MTTPSTAKRTLVAAALLFSGSFHFQAATQGPAPAAQAPEIRTAERHDTSLPLRAMPPVPRRTVEAVRKPPRRLPNRVPERKIPGDAALQPDAPSASAATLGVNFEGIGNVDGVLPPDTNGDVGPNHYVQTVNLSLAVWDKAGTTLLSPVDVVTLWQGFGGPCETNNDGDPIVLYDEPAKRWMISQFAFGSLSGPFYQCIAVSQGPDPTLAYHRYAFKIHDSKLNDYPKFGVWTDGYYMSINQFTCNFIRCSWAGQGAVVFERDQMLSGGTARMIYFDLYNVDPNLGGMLPSDLDGDTLPPAGAPNIFVQVDDDAWGYSSDQLQLWAFQTTWGSSPTASFTQHLTLGTAAFDSNMCGYSRNCIPQRDTSVKVDAISDRLMFRLQYRNFGTHRTLVTSHTVDATGGDNAGVRWYELRDSGSGWTIRQEGTYAPDGNHRWMSSAAMNGAGDIALGFSISSTTMFPSISATGRLGSDTSLNVMTQGEAALIAGTGHQTHSSGRWGDYSMMAVDPVDDCTFWYTQEYYGTKGSAPWQTRVASFRLSNCGSGGGGGGENTAPTATIENPPDGDVSGSVTVRIAASDLQDAAGTLNVQWNVDGGAWQSTTYNSGTGRYEATWNTLGVANGAHTVNARATDSGGLSATDSNGVTVVNPTAHVGDLDGSATTQKNGWTAVVTVTVHDGTSSHAPVQGATVSGSWSNGASGSGSCTTNSSGQCTVTKSSINKRSASATFTVSSVTHASATYTESANHDPDSDSNGKTITVIKP